MTNENGWQVRVGAGGRLQEGSTRTEQYPITGTIASPLIEEASTIPRRASCRADKDSNRVR